MCATTRKPISRCKLANGLGRNQIGLPQVTINEKEGFISIENNGHGLPVEARCFVQWISFDGIQVGKSEFLFWPKNHSGAQHTGIGV